MADDSAALALRGFRFERVLKEDPKTRYAALLGYFPAKAADQEEEQAVLLVEKTHFEPTFYSRLTDRSDEGRQRSGPSKAARSIDGLADAAKASGSQDEGKTLFSKLSSINQNDIYHWLLGWTAPTEASQADVKLSLICPATDSHVAKYSKQSNYMFDETPQIYSEQVLPWIESQDVKRVQWVYNILEKKKESESIIFEDPDPETGFIMLPDLKWDQKTLPSLYLTAIVHDRKLRSLRDLRPSSENPKHVELLRKIKHAASKVVAERYGLHPSGQGGEALRCFIHYHPTYYHMHVHIMSANNVLQPGALVGRAHQLEDVADLLELGVDFRKRTLRYELGERHELWQVLT